MYTPAKYASFYENEAASEGRPRAALLNELHVGSHVQDRRLDGTNPLRDEPLLGAGDYDRLPVTTPRPQPQRNENPGRDPVVGHIGRLVSNDDGVSMFAGSSTGVHFISQAEQHMQKLRIYDHTFPSSIYGLHLRNIWGSPGENIDFNLIAGIATQLPENAMTVIESAIDTWTPLYPVIHKPTALAAYRKLINDPTVGDIIHLYQMLLLLALGSIGYGGDCIRPHQHLLCLSETYYSLASTISSRILALHGLQTLQGLILAQLYMQLSCRYADASHFGGVAARLAQTLGLHRHSARFKMDPLETELRRRIWWCQYSLDAFVSPPQY